MPNQREYTFFLDHAIDLKDKKVQQQYDQWLAGAKLLQIRAVTSWTGFLYILAWQLDTVIAPKELIPLMTTLHLYLLPPLLFFISLLTLNKKFIHLILILLSLAPIGAAIGALLITVNLESPSMRLTEIYLIIFWIFTVSGLGLRLATLSALTIFIIVLVVTYTLFSMTTENFVMHCFWMSAALSFGFLAAYLLEKSYKALFVKQQQLKTLSLTDRLTGLYNRAKLDEILKDELQRSRRYNHTFGLVLLDFDYFKAINDTYGHQVGDEALKEIAALITDHLRASDKAVRWGGEEFIVVYLDTDRNEVIKLAEKLRQKIEAHPFKTVGRQTASFGVTLYTDNDTTNTIIKRADKALYKAKSKGRNCIVFL